MTEITDEMVEKAAAAIDAARYAHPDHPRERPQPFNEADKSDREYATRLARAALSTLPTDALHGVPEEIWRHNKRRTHYVVIGSAQVQATEPLTDYEVVTVYRGIEDGELWVRRISEFRERFTKSEAPATSDEDTHVYHAYPFDTCNR